MDIKGVQAIVAGGLLANCKNGTGTITCLTPEKATMRFADGRGASFVITIRKE